MYKHPYAFKFLEICNLVEIHSIRKKVYTHCKLFNSTYTVLFTVISYILPESTEVSRMNAVAFKGLQLIKYRIMQKKILVNILKSFESSKRTSQ